MRVIPTNDAVFAKIEAVLGERKEEAELQVLAGIDCDDLDIANQEKLGDEDPVATIELIVQWLPETCLLYTSPSPRDQRGSRMPSSA